MLNQLKFYFFFFFNTDDQQDADLEIVEEKAMQVSTTFVSWNLTRIFRAIVLQENGLSFTQFDLLTEIYFLAWFFDLTCRQMSNKWVAVGWKPFEDLHAPNHSDWWKCEKQTNIISQLVGLLVMIASFVCTEKHKFITKSGIHINKLHNFSSLVTTVWKRSI